MPTCAWICASPFPRHPCLLGDPRDGGDRLRPGTAGRTHAPLPFAQPVEEVAQVVAELIAQPRGRCTRGR
jgi:hypothetical protein